MLKNISYFQFNKKTKCDCRLKLQDNDYIQYNDFRPSSSACRVRSLLHRRSLRRAFSARGNTISVLVVPVHSLKLDRTSASRCWVLQCSLQTLAMDVIQNQVNVRNLSSVTYCLHDISSNTRLNFIIWGSSKLSTNSEYSNSTYNISENSERFKQTVLDHHFSQVSLCS